MQIMRILTRILTPLFQQASGGKTKDYLKCTYRNLESLWELRPGDHIRVRSKIEDELLKKCNVNLRFNTHHLLVIEVVNDTQIRAIHKTRDRGVVEEILSHQPSDVFVLDYECLYTGETAIQRARQDERHIPYNTFSANCEHFVTEVRTGQMQSTQIKRVVEVGVGNLWVFIIAITIAYALWKKL